MSNYTMELRHICEQLSGLTPAEIMFSSVDDVISRSRAQLFNFNYPLYDPAHKTELETKIIKHFYLREISGETVGMFKLFLDRTLNEIMPYYNELYHTAALEYDPLHDVDVTRTHSGTASGTHSDEHTRDGETTNRGTLSAEESGTSGNTRTEDRDIDETVTGESSADGRGTSGNTRTESRAIDETVTAEGSADGRGTSSKTTNTSTETDTETHSTGSKTSHSEYTDDLTHRDAYSDTPESSVQGVEGDGSGSGSGNVSDNYWLSNYRKVTDHKTGDSDATESTTGSETGHSESSGTQTESGITTDHNEDTRETVTDRDESGTVTDSGTTTDHRESSDQRVTDRGETATVTDAGTTSGSRSEQTSGSGTSSETGSASGSFENADDWTETVHGKQGAQSYAAMITEYRETILNIDMMVIEALEPCFMQIY